MPELVVLGRITRAQGLRGEVRVLPYGVAPEVSAKLVGKSVFLRSSNVSGLVQQTSLEHERWHKGTWIVELCGCSTREAAESLVGCELCLAEENRPPLGCDEYYPDQLVGSFVVDLRTGENLGEVTAIKPGAAADLLEVRRSNGGWFLIPLVRQMVEEVDLSSRIVRVDLPEGLMEINR
jgi:16S rRNA processing protein RimM